MCYYAIKQEEQPKRQLVINLKGGKKYRLKGDDKMSTYEALSLMIGFASLVVLILRTKK